MNHGPGCYFCGQVPHGEYRVTITPPSPPEDADGEVHEALVEVWLCRVHYEALAAAERRGRVHKPSGERWRLGWDYEPHYDWDDEAAVP